MRKKTVNAHENFMDTDLSNFKEANEEQKDMSTKNFNNQKEEFIKKKKSKINLEEVNDPFQIKQ